MGRHELLPRPVAVKIRYREEASTEEALLFHRFRQGALLQSEVPHPAIARVYDYFECPDYQALVMEYLPGGSVEDLLRGSDHGIGVGMAVEIATRSADALAAAHALDIVHRDIKPGNLMLREVGEPRTVRVTDFGVAKALDRSPDLTMPGANVGTIWYMPPEQFNNEEATPACDIYALGATLFEMVTGQLPFERRDTSEIFRRFLDKIPPPAIALLNPRVPSALIEIIERAMALDVGRRVPSCAALALLLRAVGRAEGLVDDDSRVRQLLEQAEGPALDGFLRQLQSPGGAQAREAFCRLENELRGAPAAVLSTGGGRPPSGFHAPVTAGATSNDALEDLRDGFGPSDADRTIIMTALPPDD